MNSKNEISGQDIVACHMTKVRHRLSSCVLTIDLAIDDLSAASPSEMEAKGEIISTVQKMRLILKYFDGLQAGKINPNDTGGLL